VRRSGRVPILLLVLPFGTASAQGYTARVDVRGQAVDFRGVQLDSIPIGSVITGPTGGPISPDSIAVTCLAGATFCSFYRPGPRREAVPVTTGIDLTMWGLGMSGLSLHGNGRLFADLGDNNAWPGSVPAGQLLEAYAQYDRKGLIGRLGRQTFSSRLGFTGFDGAWLLLERLPANLQLGGYVGLGLADGVALPITTAALNPFNEFQPSERQLVAGGNLNWITPVAEARLDYQREVDRDTRNFVSERAALSATVRPWRRVSISGGTEYDFSYGWWGTSDVTASYTEPRLGLSAGARHYRPYFNLWTIWGAFSPVPYNAVNGSVSLRPIPKLEVRARGERYWFEDTETETPLVNEQDDGWRWSAGATYQLAARLQVDGGFATDFGPGASSQTWSGRLGYDPKDDLRLSLDVGTLKRPLEFRFSDANLDWVGVRADWRVLSNLQIGAGAIRYSEDRNRPDNAAFSWDQTRIDFRVTYSMSSGTEWAPLPPARRLKTDR
jgi:hypothetical protein